MLFQDLVLLMDYTASVCVIGVFRLGCCVVLLLVICHSDGVSFVVTC